ncbi:MAG: hypothetical protein ACXABD_00185 [Candidatus Thorarchaeota archaeon]|jgi:hypothetical protein
MADSKQDELTKIKSAVEKMNKFHQVSILKLLTSRQGLTINENNNGVFINLSDLDNETLKTLYNYIHYVNEQESDLSYHEQEKEKYKSVYFDNISEETSNKKVKTIAKENKDNLMNVTSSDDIEAVASE